MFAAVSVREFPEPVSVAVPANMSHVTVDVTSVKVAVTVMLLGLATPPVEIWKTLLGALSLIPLVAAIVSVRPGISEGSIGTGTTRVVAAWSKISLSF
jgi:hypothetical protein